MKKTIQNTLTLFLSLSIIGCGKIEEKKNELSTSVVEKALETAGMPKMDTSNLTKLHESKVHFGFDYTQLEGIPEFKNPKGIINVSKEAIGVSILEDEKLSQEDYLSIMIAISGDDLSSAKPIEGVIKNREGNTANIGFTLMTQSGLIGYLAMEGDVKITKMSDEKAVLELDVKMGGAMDAESPEKWIPMKGKIEIENPVLVAVGAKLEDFM
ncbi:hypothetical protein [Moheibacter stercoris]|uniref:YceI-like domain-containing protein n=1 Tax=Moheibacter stercoris TaxID=1628251 RepID=A0ABV2LVH2_9FLAO